MTTELTELDETGHYLVPWCSVEDLPVSKLAAVNDVTRAAAVAAATEVLFILSGRQYRTGRSVVRPVAISSSYGTQSYLYPYSSMSGYGAAWGFAAGWSWTAVGMGWWQNGQTLSEVVLQGPVNRINRVVSTGVTLGGWPPTNPNFTLYTRRRLVRTVTPSGGSNLAASQAWPWNQQLQLPLTSSGTFAIDYEWGRPPPSSGRLAAIELSTEMILATTSTDPTRLPARVTQMQMNGMSVAVGDPIAYIREGLVGLPLCDLFLTAVNPYKLRRKSIFLAPNTPINRELPPFGSPLP